MRASLRVVLVRAPVPPSTPQTATHSASRHHPPPGPTGKPDTRPTRAWSYRQPLGWGTRCRETPHPTIHPRDLGTTHWTHSTGRAKGATPVAALGSGPPRRSTAGTPGRLGTPCSKRSHPVPIISPVCLHSRRKRFGAKSLLPKCAGSSCWRRARSRVRRTGRRRSPGPRNCRGAPNPRPGHIRECVCVCEWVRWVDGWMNSYWVGEWMYS